MEVSINQETMTQEAPVRVEGLGRLTKTVNRMRANLYVTDDRGRCLFAAEGDSAPADTRPLGRAAREILAAGGSQVRWADGDRFFGAPLGDSGRVLLIDAGPEEMTEEKAARCACLEEVVQYFLVAAGRSSTVERQIEKLSAELAQSYEQIMLLYNLSTNMNLTQSSANYLQMACDQLTQLVPVEGIAIFLEKRVDGMRRLVLTAGSGLIAIDPMMADILQMHLTTELLAGREALVDSDVYKPFKYEWPERVRNILAVPLGGPEKMNGFLVATNVLHKPDFDSTDIKLFNSVANQCAVFLANGRLFGDLKELFIGSLKALTSSIDAKDQYTRGHSERVALISRWIAEHMREKRSISERQVHLVYLAGLLHDIGKIGVVESVLCKKGKLTDEERSVILAHPRIGASILSEIPQMREIIPGVLHHHERYDGKGYPEGLAGEEIPLGARIIALADSFDAMTSRRVYRDAMSIRRALAEIEKGIGTQFDPVAARAFLDSDIERLWQIIQDGFIETWDYSNFDEYGTTAVGALMT